MSSTIYTTRKLTSLIAANAVLRYFYWVTSRMQFLNNWQPFIHKTNTYICNEYLIYNQFFDYLRYIYMEWTVFKNWSRILSSEIWRDPKTSRLTENIVEACVKPNDYVVININYKLVYFNDFFWYRKITFNELPWPCSFWKIDSFFSIKLICG